MAARFRKTRQAVEYAAVRAALSLVGRIPIDASQRIGAAIGVAAFDLVRARRTTSIDNIRASLGVARGEATRIARASYANSGRCLMEFAAFAHMTPPEILDLVSIEGLENFERVRDEGKGGVIVSAHLGNFELITAGLAAAGYAVYGLVGQQSNSRVDDVMNDLRRKQNVGIITRAAALRKVLQVLSEGGMIAMLPDQDARKLGIMVEFLGRPASTVRGPALFAIRRGCAILPAFVTRTGTRHVLTLETPLYADPTGDEDERVRDLTQRYTDRFTARIRLRPDEYFWPHRRWKTKAPQSERSQPIVGVS